jgi:hypothetical protein
VYRLTGRVIAMISYIPNNFVRILNVIAQATQRAFLAGDRFAIAAKKW